MTQPLKARLPASVTPGRVLDNQVDWNKVEADLQAVGVPLPLYHRWAWAQRGGARKYRLVTIDDARGLPLGAFALQIDRSRTLPGHVFWQVQRFGEGLPETSWAGLAARLRDLAASDSRVLKVSVRLFARHRRDEIAAAFEQLGFSRLEHPHSYRYTLTLDLAPTEDELLAGLHKTARKNLRETEKAGVSVQALTDEKYAARIQTLQAEALRRTGGNSELLDGRVILRLSREHPELSRIIGLFASPDDTSPESLVGFAWGCMHGSHGEYRAAGTSRIPGRNLAISYPLLWDLIQWSRRQGATWFDFGGVTIETGELQGISDFKRYFSRNVEEVGEEWTLVPNPRRLQLATLAGEGARVVASLIKRARAFGSAKSSQEGAHEQ